jgi:hypothetical protein
MIDKINLALFAATEKINPGDIGLQGQVTNANTALTSILNTVYFWAGIVAVIIIIVGGYLYVTANGNASQVGQAKNAIISAVVGVVIILLAFVITNFVIGRF